MSDPSSWTKEQLARQARQHLESLKGAGVEWLPVGSMPTAPTRSGEKQERASAKPPATQEHDASATPQAMSGPPPVSEMKGTSGKNLFADVGGPEPVVESKSQLSGMPLEQRRQELTVLAEKISTCTL